MSEVERISGPGYEYRREPRPELLPDRARYQIETRVYSASPEELVLLIQQRTWGSEPEPEETELLEEPPEELGDPDYDGRLEDEDADFSEPPSDEEWPSILETVWGLHPGQARQRKQLHDICFELLPSGRITFWSPLGKLWGKFGAQDDKIGGWFKRSLRGRIQTMAIIGEELSERNQEYFCGRGKQAKLLPQNKAIELLQKHLEISKEAAESRVSRLGKSALLRLPNGEVRPLAEFLKPAENIKIACELFFSLAAYHSEEKEKPYSDKQLAELLVESASTARKGKKRSNIQRVRSAWLPNSRERSRFYHQGKELPDLLKEKVGDDVEKSEGIIEILEAALGMADRRKEARAQLARECLEGWLQKVRA